MKRLSPDAESERADVRMTHGHRKWLWAGMGLVSACVVVLFIVSSQIGNRFQEELDWLAEHGEPITAAELASRYPSPDVTKETAGELYSRAGEIIFGFQTNEIQVTNVPMFDLEVKLRQQPHEPYPAENVEAGLLFLQANAEALAMMERADAMPAEVMTRYDGTEWVLPRYARLRKVTQLRALQMDMAAERGDAEGVMAAFEGLVNLNRHQQVDVPLPLTILAAQTTPIEAMRHLERAVNRTTFSEEQYATLMRHVQPWMDSRRMMEFYRSARITLLEDMDERMPWYWEALGVRSSVQAEILRRMRLAQE